jgi:hypothetical protein
VLPDGATLAPPDGAEDSDADAEALAVAAEAEAPDEAAGLPDADPDAAADADGAGAYVQPGVEPDEHAVRATIVKTARSDGARAGRRRIGLADLRAVGWWPGSVPGLATGRSRCPNLPPATGTCRGRIRETQSDRDRGRLHPTRDPELGEDVAHVDADGLLADEQALADLPIRAALGNQ